MSKDYAKKSRSPSRAGSSIPGWVWLLTGIVTGAFIMFLVYLSGLSPVPPGDKPAAVKTANTPPPPPQEKPVFEFYDTLMNNEVIPPPSQQPDSAHNKTPGVTYMLQAASFKKQADADSLRAQLTLEGLDASIAQFNNRGEIYHRVMVGPFTDTVKMDQAKKTLATHNISPIVLQKKPGA